MLPALLAEIDRHGLAVFDGGHAYNLNIVGIRSNNRDQTADAFDDWMTCTYRTQPGGSWITKWWPCTTDPGKQALLHPEMYNAQGTLIMAPGQYRSAYVLGMHANKYEALVQRGPKPINIYRDNDLDTVLDTDPDTFVSGFFGANIHKAGADSHRISGVTGTGRKWTWSAGCQVFKREQDFNELMDLCHLQIEHHPNWAKTFTYTLIEEKDLWT